MDPIYRILDANANRAREALRVMEEAARFRLGEEALTGELKQARHALASLVQQFDGLEFHRDTAGDIGTRISTGREMERIGIPAVAIAAGKRLSESLRTLEEYGKIIEPEFAAAIEVLRYRGYELERRLNLALGCGVTAQWKLCVIVTESRCRAGDWRGVASAALAAGADCLQLREKELEDRELLRRAKALRDMAADHATFIVNDRPDIALLAGADGVHLGQDDLPCRRVRELAGRRLIIGVSTSNLAAAQRALLDGADYCGVGPMFATATKQKSQLAGPEYLREFLQWNRLPHLAIGGINPSNASTLAQVGCRGVAVCAAVCGADDPAAVVKALRNGMEQASLMQSEALPRSA